MFNEAIIKSFRFSIDGRFFARRTATISSGHQLVVGSAAEKNLANSVAPDQKLRLELGNLAKKPSLS